MVSLLRGTEFRGAAYWPIQLMCNAIRSPNSTNSPCKYVSVLHAFLLKVEVNHFYSTSAETLRYVSSTDKVLRNWWLLSPYRNLPSPTQRHVSSRPSSPCSNSPHYARCQPSALSFLKRSQYFVSSEQKYVRCRLYCVLHVRLIFVLIQFKSLMFIIALVGRVQRTFGRARKRWKSKISLKNRVGMCPLV